MRFSIRTMGGAGAVILLAVAGLLHSASDRLGMASRAAGESREVALDATWQEHQVRARTTMHIALVLALAAAALGIIGAIRCNRIASP